MADLDAELLALAGGDESSADERSPSPHPTSSSPPPPTSTVTALPQHPDEGDSSPEDMAGKGTAKVVKKSRHRLSHEKYVFCD